MPKAPLCKEQKVLETKLISAMREGLRNWRPDLFGPESMSDYESLARGIIQRFTLIEEDHKLVYDAETEAWLEKRRRIHEDELKGTNRL